MSLLRVLAVIAVAGLATAQVAHAADSSTFQVMMNDSGGNPIMFQSATALRKGDVIKIHAFNAPLPMILQVAMCNSDCPHMHLVKTVELFTYFPSMQDMNREFVVPEDGHVSFWVQYAINELSTSFATRHGGWGLLSFYPPTDSMTPQLFENSPPLSANAFELDDNTLRLCYSHNIFVAVSLADASI